MELYDLISRTLLRAKASVLSSGSVVFYRFFQFRTKKFKTLDCDQPILSVLNNKRQVDHVGRKAGVI